MASRDTASELCRARELREFDAEADVVVVGLGCAGACAALEAQAAGAEVLVLERAGGGGGTSANSGGLLYLGGGTPVQQAAGFEDTPEQMFEFLVAASGPAPCEPKIALYCEGSVEHFHWLEAQGVPFKRSFHPEPSMESRTDDCLVYSGGEDCHPWSQLAHPAPRGHKPQTQGKAGPFFMQCMLRAVERRRLRVEVDVRVTQLVAEDDGRICGVLAAGGFSRNAEMLAAHIPALARLASLNAVDGDDGTGIRLGQRAGGDLLRMEQGEVALAGTMPNRLGRGIYLNQLGQRFINEDTYVGHIGIEALFRQSGRVYLLHDEQSYARNLPRMQPAHVAESIEELEREAGFPSGALQATLAFYNGWAEKGLDPLFHKRREFLHPLATPPFALLDCRPEQARQAWAGMTLGGLRTSADGEVETPDGDPIPGLYAAGRTSALFCGRGYAGSGISLGDGSFFGRRAGRAAARAR